MFHKYVLIPEGPHYNYLCFSIFISGFSLLTQVLTKRGQDEAMTEIPQLPGVRHLTIKFCSHNSHYLGATVSSLLARCSNLEYLHLDNLIHLVRF
jgi:hypothetical protein